MFSRAGRRVFRWTTVAGRRPGRWRPGWLTCPWTRSSPARWTAAARPRRRSPRHGTAPSPAVQEDEQFAEVKYGDWTGQPLKRLAKDPLWRVVQAHPSAVRFPGKDAESMPEVQHRAVNAVREWNARLGKDAVYLICSHGDVIKSVIADSLGLHLDLSQRIQVDPCSLSVIRYTPLRPFLVRMNDTGRTAAGLARPPDAGAGAGKAAANGGAPQAAAEGASRPPFGEGDAAIGGGAGG